MLPNEPKIELVECVSEMMPAPGVHIYQAIIDAQLWGFEKIEIDLDKNIAVITWFKKKEEQSDG